MSQTIDNRIVELQFENKQFESGVEESLTTLEKLKRALKLDDAAKNLENFGKSTKNFNLNDIGAGVEKVSDKFSAFGAVGFTVIQRLTNAAIDLGKKFGSILTAPIEQAKSGGWTRAMNIEEAKFQIEGLGVAWDEVAEDINYGVQDTAYGLDVAAKACSQLLASGVQVGEEMKHSLLAISGVAAMTSSSYEEISPIFTTVAGQGVIMTRQLRQLEARGLNAAAVLGEQLGYTEAEIRDMVHNSEIDFNTFSEAMFEAFGQHAKDANQTFQGALANVKAALNKIGAEFATPFLQNAVPVLNQVRLFINEIKAAMGPLFQAASGIMEIVSEFLSNKIAGAIDFMQTRFTGAVNLGNALYNVIEAIVRIIGAIRDAFHAAFPESLGFGNAINSLCEGIELFSEKLIMSDDALYGFRDVMIVVFTILKSVGKVLGIILKVVGKVLIVVFKIIGVIGRLIVGVGSLISKLQSVKSISEAIQQAGGLFVFLVEKLKGAFASLKASLSDTSTVTGQFGQKVKEIGEVLLAIIGGPLLLAFSAVKSVIDALQTADPLGTILANLKNFVNTLKELPIIGKVVSGIQFVIESITNMISGLIDYVKNLIESVKSGIPVLDAVKEKVSSIETPFDNIKKKIENFINTHENLKKTLEVITAGFNTVKNALIGFFGILKSKAKEISAGQVLLFSFGFALTMLAIKAAKAFESFSQLTGSVKGFFGALSKAISNYGKKHSTFLQVMIGISVGLATLAGAIWVIAQIPKDKLQQVVISLLALIGVIGLFSAISSGIGKGSGSFAASMISLAAGIAVLIGALYALDGVNFDNIKTKLIVLGVICAGMLVISAILSVIAPKFAKGGIAVLFFAGAIYMLAKALEVISNADLANIQNSWKELTAVILAFAAFVSIASNIGIGASIALVAFVGFLNLALKHLDELKKHFGDIQNAIKTVADYLKSTFRYLYEAIKKVAEDIEKSEILGYTIGGGVTAIIVTLTSVILALGHAGKGLKRAAFGFVLLIGAIAGLMFVMAKVSELLDASNGINFNKLKNLLENVFIFIGIIAGIAALPGHISRSKGTGDKNKSLFLFDSNGTKIIRELRKMIMSIALLVLSIGAFSAMIGSLNPAQFEQAKKVLSAVGTVLVVLSIISAVITNVGSKTQKASASFGTFGGVVLLIGSLIGTIAILMFMFNGVNWDKDKKKLLMVAAAFSGIVIAVIAIIGMIAKLKKNSQHTPMNTAFATIGALTGLLLVIGGIVYAFSKLTASELNKAKGIAIAVGIFLVAITALTGIIQKVSKNNLNTKNARKGFTQTLIALGVMIASIVVLAGTALMLKNVNAGKMVGQLATLTAVLYMIAGLVMAIAYLTRRKEFKLTTKTELKSLHNFMVTLRELFIEFTALALIGTLMSVFGNPGAMAAQFATLTAVLYLVAGLAMAISYLTRREEFKSTTKTEAKSIHNFLVTLRELLIELTALAVIGVLMSRFGDPKAMAVQFATLVGVIIVLGVLVLAINKVSKTMQVGVANIAIFQGAMTGLIIIMALIGTLLIFLDRALPSDMSGVLGKVTDVIAIMVALGIMAFVLSKSTVDMAKNAALGEAVLAGMIGLFAALTLVLMLVNKLPAEGLLAKMHVVTLCLLELTVIAYLAKDLGEDIRNVGLGELALAGMLGLFTLLTLVFKIIAKLNSEKLLAKAESIMLCLLELWAIGELCALLGKSVKNVLIGEALLLAMIGLFAILTQVFKVINRLNTKGILAKSQSIILCLLELWVMAVACVPLGIPYVAILSGIGQVVLLAMIGVFAVLVQVFKVINRLETKGILAKSQTIILVLLELVVMANVIAALVAGVVVGGIASVFLLPLIGVFSLLTDVFGKISALKTEGILQKSQVIILVLVELASICALMGVLVVAMVLGGISAWAMQPLIDVFTTLAMIFMVLQHVETKGIAEKSNEILKCLLKLVGISALLGLLFPLALLSRLGTPAILEMCEGIVQIAKALKIVENVSIGKMEKTVDIFTSTLLKLAGIGVVGILGAPGLIALANGVLILGEACLFVGSGFEKFSTSLLQLALLTPTALENMKKSIAAFFNGVKDGIITLAFAVEKALMIIALGAIKAAGQIKGFGEVFDFLFEKLEEFIDICYYANRSALGLIAVGLAVKWIGQGVGAAGKGIEQFAEALKTLGSMKPEEIQALQDAIVGFFDAIYESIEVIGKLLAGVIILSAAMMILGPGFLTLVIGINIFASAVSKVIETMETFANALTILGKITPEQAENIKNAVAGFFNGIAEGKEGVNQFVALLWNIVGAISVATVVVGLFSPALVALGLVLAGIIALVLATVTKINAMLTDQSIPNNIRNLGQAISETIISIGQSIVAAVAIVINGIKQVLGIGAEEIGESGTTMSESFKTHAITALAGFAGDFLASLQMGFSGGTLGGIVSVGVSIGTALMNGFRKATTWGSPLPAIFNDFAGDFGASLDMAAQKIAPYAQKLGIDTGKLTVENVMEGAKELIPEVTDLAYDTGADVAQNVGKAAKSNDGDFNSWIDEKMGQIFGIRAEISAVNAELNSAANRGWGTVYEFRNQAGRNYDSKRAKLLKEQRKLEMYKADYEKGMFKGAKKPYEGGLTQLNKDIQANKKSLDELNKEIEKTGNNGTKAASIMDQFANGLDDVTTSAGGAASEMKDFESELTNVLEGQMNIFEEFQEKEAISKDKLLANMRSQIEGMTKWASNMQALAAKGIDQGLYEKLAMMGPEGAQYVAAFNEMTADELMQANVLWAKSLVLPSTVSKQVTASFNSIGTNIMAGWLNGVNFGRDELLQQLGVIAMECHTTPEGELGIQSPSTVFYAIGAYMMLGLKEGIRAKWKIAQDALKFVCGQLVSDAEKLLSPDVFYTIGVNLIDGLTAGLKDKDAIKRLIDRIYELAKEIEAAATGPGGADTGSPSKKTKRLGKYLVEGLALGLKDPRGLAAGAAEDLAAGAVDSMKETIAGVAKNLLEDDDFTPVITPVLDLSNIQAGAKTLNGMFSTNQALMASGSINDLQNAQINGVNGNTTFIQNNYSPKALNRIEIYRQTRNQFAQYREAMQ